MYYSKSIGTALTSWIERSGGSAVAAKYNDNGDRGWVAENGDLAIETNGDPVFEDQDGFSEYWMSLDYSSGEVSARIVDDLAVVSG